MVDFVASGGSFSGVPIGSLKRKELYENSSSGCLGLCDMAARNTFTLDGVRS